MNTLSVSAIKKSIALMDKFQDGNYDYLELDGWFNVKDSKDRSYSFDDNTGLYNISLLVSKTHDKSKGLCEQSPTMTELRQMQHHYIALDKEYRANSMDAIICEACKRWEKDVLIELSSDICLNAQTSWNRMDYGCEWSGGGDWEEKTLYGETTSFYITGIILKEPLKSTTQKAREILKNLNKQHDENMDYIENAMREFKHIDQTVIHKKYGKGYITEVLDNKIRVSFATNEIMFTYPDSFMQGFLSILDYSDAIVKATEKWNHNIVLEKEIKKFEVAKRSIVDTYQVVHDYEHKELMQ